MSKRTHARTHARTHTLTHSWTAHGYCSGDLSVSPIVRCLKPFSNTQAHISSLSPVAYPHSAARKRINQPNTLDASPQFFHLLDCWIAVAEFTLSTQLKLFSHILSIAQHPALWIPSRAMTPANNQDVWSYLCFNRLQFFFVWVRSTVDLAN